MKTNNIVSFSGGKDSTAMLHWMIERKEPIHSVIYFDTGWEFPAMADHVNLVKEKTNLRIIHLKPEKSFLYWMLKHQIKARTGHMKGRVHLIGRGWPSHWRPWCAEQKIKTLNHYISTIPNAISCVGIAAEEQQRIRDRRYPLVEYGKTSADCLKYCKELGYHWNGLYDIFTRVSCFCCPQQRIPELRNLRKHFPDLWDQMLIWDLTIPHNRGYKRKKTVLDFEYRFAQEDNTM